MSYAKEAAAVSGHEPVERQGSCCVAGCPLPGTINDSTTGGSDWLCRVHHGSAYADRAAISARIANRFRFYTLALRLTNSPPARHIPEDVKAWLTRHGRPEFLNATPARKDAPLTCRRLGASMLMALDDECRAPQQRIEQADRQTQAAGGFVKAAELIEDLA